MKLVHNAMLMNYVDAAMIPPESGQPAVIDFTVELFRFLKYACGNRLARMRLELPLLICGKSKHVKINVCIFDCSQRQFLLLVHEEKMLVHGETSRAQAQLVMEAVAAFNENNVQREADGHPPLAEKVGHFVSFLTLF